MTIVNKQKGLDMPPSKITRGVNTKVWFAALVCFVGALFYFYDFFLQSLPGIISLSLIRDLKIGAGALGLLSGAYFFTYTPMQLVAGLLYDRYGPRILLTIMIAVCGIGAMLFSFAHGLVPAILGRMLMGLSSAFSFVCALGLIARWFDKRFFAPLIGLVQALSSLGAITAAIPMAILVSHIGWRGTSFWVGIIGLILAIIVFCIVRDEPKYSKSKSKSKKIMTPYHKQGNKNLLVEEISRLFSVLKRRHTWRIGLYAFVMWAPMTIFTELWGIPYLNQVYHMSEVASNAHMAIIWIAVAIFSPLVGIFSQLCSKRLLPMRITALIGLLGAVVLLFAPGVFHSVPVWLIWVSLFCFGIGPTGAILSFAVVKDYNRENLGAAIGFNNMMVVLGGAFFQPLVGVLINMFWDFKAAGETPVYTFANYQIGLSIVPLCFFAGFIISLFFIKETNCDQVILKK